MTLIVSGGRGFKDVVGLSSVLQRMHRCYGIELLVQGGCSGADKLAHAWAEAFNIPTKTYYPNWRDFGKAAGPLRNQEMLDQHPLAYVLILPGGRGTADMLRRAKEAGRMICGGYEAPTRKPTTGGTDGNA